MSIDTKYIIQYEGPFAKNELEDQVERLNNLPASFGFNRWEYDTIIGEVKSSEDEAVIDISRESSPVHILKSSGGGFWETLWRIDNKKD